MTTSPCARAAAPLTSGLVAAVTLGAALLGVGQPAPASAAVRGPDLAVAVTDGRTAAQAGDRLTYTVTVSDTGTTDARRLSVTQTLSPGLRLVSASAHGRLEGGQVSWSASLPAHGTRTFQVVTRVTKPPATLLRLSAVACVTLPGSKRPAVCAAHLDRLPAAAAASRSSTFGLGPAAYAAGGAAVLVLGLLALVARRQTRRRRQPA